MNLFVTIMCFALIATAAADVGGYNYNQPKSGVKQNIRPQAAAGSSGIYSGQLSPPLPAYNVQPQLQAIKQNFIAAPVPAPAPAPPRQYVQQQQALPLPQIYHQPAVQAAQYIAPVQQPAVYAPTYSAASAGSAQIQFNQQPQQQTIVSKDIYIHTAPEETEEIGFSQNEEAVPVRKNYRIVFIKAPSQNIKYNVETLKRTQAANEEKTVIYVLSKKPDITTIHNQLTNIQSETKSHKPEVYFIKYKTQEEANRAQQEIQAQYDALGGSTRVSDEGIAPITSVISGGGISAAPTLISGSAGGLSLSDNSNFLQAASNNQQQFVQSAIQGGQGSASSLNFAVQGPGNKYLPVQKK